MKERNHKVKEDKPKDGNKKRKRKRTQIMKIKNENKIHIEQEFYNERNFESIRNVFLKVKKIENDSKSKGIRRQVLRN